MNSATGSVLDRELIELQRQVHQFCALATRRFTSTCGRFNAVVAGIHSMSACLDELDPRFPEPSALHSVIAPAVVLQGTSPFVRRLHEWPRGYPGDFETIEYILEGRNRAPVDSIAFDLERYVLNSAPACQHRNKVQLQAARIEQLCRATSKPRILVLAAGSAADLVQALPALVACGASVTINDADPAAIELCRRRLQAISAHATYIVGNALVITSRLAAGGPYDLIVAGGLFDYLPAAYVRRLVSRLSSCLARSGSLYFSNIAAGNPYRSWMRYFGNWTLIERTEQEVRDLALMVGNGAVVSIDRDITGLSLLVDSRRTQ